MEPVAADRPPLAPGRGKRVRSRADREVSVKRGVEAGDGWEVGHGA